MKNLMCLPLAVCLFLVSCAEQDATFGSGRAVTETRAVNPFTKVKSEGVFEVTIAQGLEQSVEITADDNVIGLVKTTVVNNELRLSLKNDGYHNVTLKARITVPRLNGLTNSGTGTMEVSSISENGAFKVVNSGTGDITITGKAYGLSIYNEGTGRFEGFDFIVKDADVKNLGAGLVKVHCSESLKVAIEGSGKAFYKGHPLLEVDIKGSGSVVNAN